MNPRTRSRSPASIGSNQSSRSAGEVAAAGCKDAGFVVTLVMVWSPARRVNAGRFEVDHPGDYATFNSNRIADGTAPVVVSSLQGVTPKAVYEAAAPHAWLP